MTSRYDEKFLDDTMTSQDTKTCKITHFYKAFLNRTRVRYIFAPDFVT